MKLIYLIFFTSLFAYSNSRIYNHKKAVSEFSKLNFFYEGKGMVISPDMVRLYDALKQKGIGVSDYGLLNKRWGLNLKDKQIKGFFSIPYKKMQMGVLGCVACHSAKAAGQYIVGLGNKNIDVGMIGKDAYLAQFLWGMLPRKNPEFKKIHKNAVKFTSVLKDKNINNLTQGLVPTSLVKTWFYEIQGKKIPKNFGRGQVKVPHLWGYGEKRKSGSFWDGFADGRLPGWAVAVELRGGQSVENIRKMLDKIHHAEDLLSDLLPPKYPFKIDYTLAIKGRKLFNKTCYKCHGTYEKDIYDLPIYKTVKFIPLKVVKTDEERLNFVTEDFLRLIQTNPLNDILTYVSRPNRRGYVAPRLEGIWSRFPYLHNASVPTLYDLLSSSKDRPIVFDLYKSGQRNRFDEKKGGLLVNRDINSSSYKRLLKNAKKGKRFIYYTGRVGHGNFGHEYSFYSKLNHEDRIALIEYLKTL
ncbi:MAG: hypothetical protein N4A33_04700 [Bacteriovoracaceae bacterium]|jgi:hypothetical protein|nr:hypothetical protein [Bacteriovoracaceae bacterium]